MEEQDEEEKLLRSVALQNARSILIARQRAEEATAEAQEMLRESARRLQLALAAGYQIHLAKPVEPTVLVDAIERLANSDGDPKKP